MEVVWYAATATVKKLFLSYWSHNLRKRRSIHGELMERSVRVRRYTGALTWPKGPGPCCLHVFTGKGERGGGAAVPALCGAVCTHVGVAQLVLPIGPNAGDGCRPGGLWEALSCPGGPHAMVAAGFRAVEETGSCRKALVMGQRQLVDGGFGGLQSRTRATVTLVQRPMLGGPVGRQAVAVVRTGWPLRPGMSGRGPLPPKPLRRVCGVRLQW